MYEYSEKVVAALMLTALMFPVAGCEDRPRPPGVPLSPLPSVSPSPLTEVEVDDCEAGDITEGDWIGDCLGGGGDGHSRRRHG